MCYILTTDKLTEEHIEVMEMAWLTNSDMAGIAYHNGKSLLMIKPIPTWKTLRRNMRRLLGYPAIVHCRLATHGAVNGFNTHPFWTCKNKALLAHNGIMPAPWSCTRDRSDSRNFADNLLKSTYQDIKTRRDPIGKVIGFNKVAIMQEDGEIFHINADQGYWDNADWYSANPDYLLAARNYASWVHGGRGYRQITYIDGIHCESYCYPPKPTQHVALTDKDRLFPEPMLAKDDREEYENYLKRREPINKELYNRHYGRYEELEGGCQ